jgi:hypothetical protein
MINKCGTIFDRQTVGRSLRVFKLRSCTNVNKGIFRGALAGLFNLSASFKANGEPAPTRYCNWCLISVQTKPAAIALLQFHLLLPVLEKQLVCLSALEER